MPIDFVEGFDRYPNTGGGVGVRGSWVFTSVGSLVTGRVGGQALELATGLDNWTIYRPITPTLQHSIFFAHMHTNSSGGTQTNFVSIRNVENIELFGLQWFPNDDLAVFIRGAEVARFPLTHGPNVWKGFSIVCERHASLGIFQLRVDGELLVNLANIDTTFQSGTQVATNIKFEGKNTSGFGGSQYIDDIRVDYDTLVPIPEGRLTQMIPNSDVAAAWSRLSGANNYLMVDETTCDSDTTYNFSNTLNAKDEYGFAPLGFSPDVIHAVQVSYAARKDDAATRVLGVTLKSGVNSAVMNDNFLSTDYTWAEQVFTPADVGEVGSIPLAALNAMTVEVEDLGDGT